MLQQAQDDRSLGELISDLTREMGTLVRDEVNLAKAEMTQKAGEAGKNVGFIAAGGIFALAGLMKLLDAAIAALATVMPVWAAALIVGLVVMAIAGALVMKGINALKHQDMAPRQTMETLKEDAQWAKRQMT